MRREKRLLVERRWLMSCLLSLSLCFFFSWLFLILFCKRSFPIGWLLMLSILVIMFRFLIILWCSSCALLLIGNLGILLFHMLRVFVNNSDNLFFVKLIKKMLIIKLLYYLSITQLKIKNVILVKRRQFLLNSVFLFVFLWFSLHFKYLLSSL